MNPKAPHRFSNPTRNFFEQLDSPSGSLNPAYSQVQNGININHGWKIHADLVTDLSKDEGLAKMGRGADLSIIDQDLADAFDQRLGKLGMNFDDFHKFYGTAYQMHGKPGELGYLPRYADPNDILSISEVFDRNEVNYKIGLSRYREGRHVTAYPTDIVERDNLISDLEETLGDRLVDQNDPTYRASLSESVGNKNAPLSRGVSGRYTTDYLPDPDPVTGKIDFTDAGSSGNGTDETYKITGEINEEQIKKIEKLSTDVPEMAELLHGPEGYETPYKTIDDIIYERQNGIIAPTYSDVDRVRMQNGLPPKTATASPTPAPTPAPAPSPAPAAPTPQPAAPTPQPVAPPPQPTATATPRNQKPVGQPVQTAAPTSAPTAAPNATTKPVGRPVISVTASPPPPTGAGAQQVSAQVTQTGNATPKPAAAKITATVQNTPPPPAKVVTSGAPTPKPLLKKTGDDISQALLGGTKGTRNIKLAGAAALLGLGAFAVSRNARPSSDDYERKLEMQRRGMMM